MWKRQLQENPIPSGIGLSWGYPGSCAGGRNNPKDKTTSERPTRSANASAHTQNQHTHSQNPHSHTLCSRNVHTSTNTPLTQGAQSHNRRALAMSPLAQSWHAAFTLPQCAFQHTLDAGTVFALAQRLMYSCDVPTHATYTPTQIVALAQIKLHPRRIGLPDCGLHASLLRPP